MIGKKHEAVGLVKECGAVSWTDRIHFKDAAAWHDKAVAFVKRIGKW